MTREEPLTAIRSIVWLLPVHDADSTTFDGDHVRGGVSAVSASNRLDLISAKSESLLHAIFNSRLDGKHFMRHHSFVQPNAPVRFAHRLQRVVGPEQFHTPTVGS